MAKRPKLPPKPEFGSIEMNKCIRAVNGGKPNPCPDIPRAVQFYNNVKAQRERDEKEHPDFGPVIFSLCEPDEYEEALLEGLLPDGWEDEIDALREAKKKK